MIAPARPQAVSSPHVAASSRPTRAALSALALAASLALAACGGGGNTAATADLAAESSTAAAPAAASSAPSPSGTGVAAAEVPWNTSFHTSYQVKTESDLGLRPTALNSRGDIAGIIRRDLLVYAALWNGGQIRSSIVVRDFSPCYGGLSCSIPDVPLVDEQRRLYVSWNYRGPSGMSLWRDGANTLESLNACVQVHGISDAGDVLCTQASGLNRSGLWNLQTMQPMLLSGEETAMNRAGTRAGVASTDDWHESTPTHHLFRVKGGDATVSEWLHGYTSVTVTHINAQDVVIGQRALPTDNGPYNSFDPSRTRPFVWKPGSEPETLPCPEDYGVANDIQSDGTIVGACLVSNGDSFTSMAVLWKDGQLVDLGPHAGAAGWILSSAGAVNDLGWMLAYGHPKGSDAADEPVVLMPQP